MALLKPRRSLALALLALSIVGVIVLYGVISRMPPEPPSLASLGHGMSHEAGLAKEVSTERGRYLAIAGNCASCHTVAGGQPYGGGAEFHTPFGVLYSTNISPHPESGIGGWSFEDFYRSMKHGVRPDGANLYPAFPYTSFAKMSDEDIASLYLYLQTVEPVNQPARENALRFPFNQRAMLTFWKLLFHDADTFAPDPNQSDAWNRGAYLVEGVAHCGACHTPRNALGAERRDLALTGGVYMDKVKFGGYRQWSAVNLTPHETGLAAWSEDDIVAYLRFGQNEHTVVHGPMNKVVVDSTHHLSDEDLRAMAIYLKSIPPNAVESDPETNEEVLAAGKITYTVHCGSCHLPTGLGDTILGVPMAGNSIVQAPDPATLINVILYGPDVPPPPFLSDRSRMRMYGKRLSDDDIAHVATYLRASFGNRAGPVSPEQVARQR